MHSIGFEWVQRRQNLLPVLVAADSHAFCCAYSKEAAIQIKVKGGDSLAFQPDFVERKRFVQTVDAISLLSRPRSRHKDAFVWEAELCDGSGRRRIKFGRKLHVPDIIDENSAIDQTKCHDKAIWVELQRTNFGLVSKLKYDLAAFVIVHSPRSIGTTQGNKAFHWWEAHIRDLGWAHFVHFLLVFEIPHLSTRFFKCQNCDLIALWRKFCDFYPLIDLNSLTKGTRAVQNFDFIGRCGGQDRSWRRRRDVEWVNNCVIATDV